MPRNYVKKSAGPSYTYTSEDIRRAVEDVANKNKTYRAAEEFYGVPKSVICQRLTGKRRTPIVLSAQVENTIEKCILARAEYGYPCGKNELQDLVKTYVESKELQTYYKNNRPGDDCPNKACFIYNADESGFPSDPSRIRAIGRKGRPLCRVSGGSGRENTTVLACIGADGSVLPPLVVFKGAAVQPRWVSEKEYPGTRYTTSSNGWMEEPQFFHWFTNSTKFSISEFTGNSVDSTLQEREKMQPPNVSYLRSCFQEIISSTSQSSATDISNQPLVLQTSLQQIDMSDEPTTSQVNTHPMIDSQNATQNTNVSKKPSATNGSEIENLFFKRTELEDVVQQKTTNVRLKQKTYGEVLTTEDVLKRLKEAEEKKQLKKKRPKLQNTEIETIKVKKLKKQKWTLTENASDSSLDENDEDEIDIKACQFSEQFHFSKL
ncbi:unnamed protein product [Acanthoscelides obtectus]|uniref:DDE-1 domain-containing protein n=1 Tax=Acanthoscelides obtectus TaxID=200917 RepID=A0A9P0M5B4_ACAOB|nr:unnamed protein product [Acanthoscelides obtectus]CAK1670431.1 hypothetical protein AOBTE_LOCUS27632 [Acanthoscelides obtectus]